MVNQSEHFGLAKLKQWLDSDEIVDQFCLRNDTTAMTRHNRQQLIISGSAMFMLCQWMEISMIYMNYIAFSDEHPLGEVKHIWWRHEYQDTMGNLSHIHALIWLKDGESEDATLDRIRGSTDILLGCIILSFSSGLFGLCVSIGVLAVLAGYGAFVRSVD